METRAKPARPTAQRLVRRTLPATAFAHVALQGVVAWQGNVYYGLWYPIIITQMTFVTGMLSVREIKDRNSYAED